MAAPRVPPVTDSSTYLSATADAYDSIATVYADLPRDDLRAPSLDHAWITAFAERVRAEGGGTVAEFGCGPGPVTALLRDLGLNAFGVDVSPAMIDLARQTYPDIRFEVGSTESLARPGEELRGIVSWYSLIHTPPEEVPAYLAEFHGALPPGGHLLLAFFESEGAPVTPFDHKVTTAYRWPIDDLADLARRAGFTELGRMLREPGEGERFRRGHLLMRR